MDIKELNSKRLYIRKITKDDVKYIYEYLSDDKVTKYLGKESLKNIEEAYEIIDKIILNYGGSKSIRLGIILKESDKLIGTIGFDGIHMKNKRAEIGYDINSKYWKNGYGYEAIREVIKFGFYEMGLNRIGAVVFEENVASNNLLKKIGFKNEGVIREYIIQNGIPKDTIMYSLLKSEYQLK